jgi:hypothetical protein
MSNLRPNRHSPVELRARAARCFQMAAKVPHGLQAETLKAFGHEYLKMAEKLEALGDELSKPRRA